MSDDDNYDLAIGGSYQHILISSSYTSANHFCFDWYENVGNYHISLIMRPDFAVANWKINRIIRKLIEAGFLAKWQRDFKSNHDDGDVEVEESMLLGFNSLSFAFGVVYSTGVILGILSFICELIIARKMTKFNRHWLWIYFEWIFDGQRHFLIDLIAKLQQVSIQQRI